MAKIKPESGDIKAGGATKAELDRIKRRAWQAAQKKRRAGDFTPVDKLIKEDLKKNRSKYLIELRSKTKNSKQKFNKLIEGK